MEKLARRIDRKWYLLLPVCALGAFLFLLFASPTTTPLNPYFGGDSAFFLLIGKGIRHGLRPYVDLYDQKGPLIFYINALGYLLTDSKLGVFLLQAVFMTGVLFVLWRLARLFLGLKRSAVVMLVFAFLFCATVQEGDMTEEWSLIFSLLPMYLALRFVKSERPLGKHPLGYAFLYGVCLAVQLLFRVTNAAMVGGLILGFTVLLSLKKDFGALGRNAGAVLLGATAVLLPVCLYFRHIGILDEFLYASLSHNFSYAVNGAVSKTVWIWAYTLLSIASILLTLVCTPRLIRAGAASAPVMTLLNAMGIAGAAAMTVGFGYRHYFLLIVPVIVADACVWLRYLSRSELPKARRRTAALVLAAVFLLPYVPQAVRHAGKSILYNGFHYMDGEMSRYKVLNEHIAPGTEGVWGYNVAARSYLYLDVLPCYRHFALQAWMAEAEPSIAREIDEMLRTDPPEWVFLTRTETEMIERLVTDYGYECVAEYDSSLFLAIYRKLP